MAMAYTEGNEIFYQRFARQQLPVFPAISTALISSAKPYSACFRERNEYN
jgi:hypothetical protein